MKRRNDSSRLAGSYRIAAAKGSNRASIRFTGRKVRQLWLVLLITLLAGVGPLVHADVSEEWIVHSVEDPLYEATFYQNLAVDAVGNVYVTGAFETWSGPYGDDETLECVTAKYTSTGAFRWISRFSTGDFHQGEGLAIDAARNVYVTGQSASWDPYQLYVTTIKYDGEGPELWVRHYKAGDTLFLGGASPLALDSEGNVYVVGYVRDEPDAPYDYLTIAYDTDGNERWVKRYDHGYSDIARAVAVDAQGNVYVTGSSYDAVSGNDFLTLKYDTNGNELWISRYDHGPSDGGQHLTLDAAGNVYVAGLSGDTEAFSLAFSTVKYDSGG